MPEFKLSKYLELRRVPVSIEVLEHGSEASE